MAEDLHALRVGIALHHGFQLGNDPYDIRKRLGNRETRVGRIPHRFLNERNAVPCRKAREDLLRPLPHEIPAQMGVNDNWQLHSTLAADKRGVIYMGNTVEFILLHQDLALGWLTATYPKQGAGLTLQARSAGRKQPMPIWVI